MLHRQKSINNSSCNTAYDQRYYTIFSIIVNICFKKLNLFSRNLNRGCLVYMFSFRFLGSKFLLNLRRQFRVRKQHFAGFEVILCLKLLFRKCVTSVAGCSFTKTCSLTGC